MSRVKFILSVDLAHFLFISMYFTDFSAIKNEIISCMLKNLIFMLICLAALLNFPTQQFFQLFIFDFAR